VPEGRLVYTQWLNERGGIEADLTVTRLGETSFLVVTGAASQTHDFAWLRRHLPDGGHVFARDVTSGLATLAIMGPKSRALLQAVSDADFSNEAFPFGSSREVEIGYGRVRASRVSYVGELGWELLIPAEFAQHVFDTITAAGPEFALRHAGYFALNSLRIEKGYRHWGHDIGVEDTPMAAGLGFAVAWEKPGGFIGRDALLRKREAGALMRRLVQIRMKGDNAPLLFHEEPIWRAGTRVGSITSGAWGHTVNASLGMGYVTASEDIDAAWLAAAPLEIEVAWQRYPAEAQLAPWYDPKGTRMRG
jgi:4-methylaminobutanoate oxidase (formaldehyde-forming)